jgi:hypothetical protein
VVDGAFIASISVNRDGTPSHPPWDSATGQSRLGAG